jgi:hypothetical protein
MKTRERAMERGCAGIALFKLANLNKGEMDKRKEGRRLAWNC